mmetsp:Transcript_32864/g.45856  ORF Transcript_32864/g.45856 Transcript_32864/m.45856 type:complete len:80 (+) Transcript_32864:85-324(+)
MKESAMDETVEEHHKDIKEDLGSSVHRQFLEGNEDTAEGQKEENDHAEFEVEVLIGKFYVLELGLLHSMNSQYIIRIPI